MVVVLVTRRRPIKASLLVVLRFLRATNPARLLRLVKLVALVAGVVIASPRPPCKLLLVTTLRALIHILLESAKRAFLRVAVLVEGLTGFGALGQLHLHWPLIKRALSV